VCFKQFDPVADTETVTLRAMGRNSSFKQFDPVADTETKGWLVIYGKRGNAFKQFDPVADTETSALILSLISRK
jgi:hypothetical protein